MLCDHYILCLGIKTRDTACGKHRYRGSDQVHQMKRIDQECSVSRVPDGYTHLDDEWTYTWYKITGCYSHSMISTCHGSKIYHRFVFDKECIKGESKSRSHMYTQLRQWVILKYMWSSTTVDKSANYGVVATDIHRWETWVVKNHVYWPFKIITTSRTSVHDICRPIDPESMHREEQHLWSQERSISAQPSLTYVQLDVTSMINHHSHQGNWMVDKIMVEQAYLFGWDTREQDGRHNKDWTTTPTRAIHSSGETCGSTIEWVWSASSFHMVQFGNQTWQGWESNTWSVREIWNEVDRRDVCWGPTPS